MRRGGGKPQPSPAFNPCERKKKEREKKRENRGKRAACLAKAAATVPQANREVRREAAMQAFLAGGLPSMRKNLFVRHEDFQ